MTIGSWGLEEKGPSTSRCPFPCGFPVYVDERKIAQLDKKRLVLVRLDAGRHTLRSRAESHLITIDAIQGERYWFEVNVPGFGYPKLIPVLEAKATSEILEKHIEPLEASKVFDLALVDVGASCR